MSNNKIERYSCYDFNVWEFCTDCHRMEKLGYCYTIYNPGTKEIVRESNEWYETECRARFAAIGHISLLENGEG